MASEVIDEVDAVLCDVQQAVICAQEKHPPYNGPHETYGVLLEEVDEFFDEVKKQNEVRSKEAMKKELLDIATVAVRAIVDLKL